MKMHVPVFDVGQKLVLNLIEILPTTSFATKLEFQVSNN